ncbi:2-iminoacetate synthase (ThiH) [Brevinematales bacterium NS]|nr:2-iminoacetate synthase ThiH [Brevinematales bacterium]QJR21876.1 2-iminoacetate synthase (ThiH) [Brevinematales bacterium NS]
MKATTEFLSWLEYDIEGFVSRVTSQDVKRVLRKDSLTPEDFLCLLSPAAEGFLEEMAILSQKITAHHFGRAILLFAPLYIADYCQNQCVYCGFRAQNRFPRTKLSLEEIRKNGEVLSEKGFRHILLLTGDAPSITPVDFLEEVLSLLSPMFDSLAVEVYPLSEEEYLRLRRVGLDGLTIYQETYDREVYDEVHPAGPKKDYLWRLGTPERGALAGLRWITIGALYGLANPLHDAFWTGMHLLTLKKYYPSVEWGLSLPRMNPAEGDFVPTYHLSDKKFVQFLFAFRIFFPTAGITLSTRERPQMRDILLPLGVTKVSAESHTEVGGYAAQNHHIPQFEVADNRSVEEMIAVIRSKGFEPVFKDWVGVL